MTNFQDLIPADDLLKSLSQVGFSITHRKLVDWQNKGAIPRPVRRFLGKGHGTRSYYPPQTVEQIKALLSYLQEKRSLEQAILNLWTDGYQVDIRSVVSTVLNKYEHSVKKLYHGEGENRIPSDKAVDLIEAASDYRQSRLPPELNIFRSRLRKDDFSSFLGVVTYGMASIDRVQDEEDTKAVIKAMYRKASSRVYSEQDYNTVGSGFSDVVNHLTPEHLRTVFDHTSDGMFMLTYLSTGMILDIFCDSLPVLKKVKPFEEWDVASQIFATLFFLDGFGSLMALYNLRKPS